MLTGAGVINVDADSISSEDLNVDDHGSSVNLSVIDVDADSSSSEVAHQPPPPLSSSSDEEDLEIPYYQNLIYPGSSQRDTMFMPKEQEEPLRAGDIIEYTNPIFVAGSKQGRRVTQVVKVKKLRHNNNSNGNEFPLELHNGECIPQDTRLKRVRECVGNRLHPHTGCIYRALGDFRLVTGQLEGAQRRGMAWQVKQFQKYWRDDKKKQDEMIRKVYQETTNNEDSNDNSDEEDGIDEKSKVCGKRSAASMSKIRSSHGLVD